MIEWFNKHRLGICITCLYFFMALSVINNDIIKRLEYQRTQNLLEVEIYFYAWKRQHTTIDSLSQELAMYKMMMKEIQFSIKSDAKKYKYPMFEEEFPNIPSNHGAPIPLAEGAVMVPMADSIRHPLQTAQRN